MADNGLEDPFPSFSDEELNNSFRVTTKGVPYRNTGETTEIPFAGVEEDVRVPDMQNLTETLAGPREDRARSPIRRSRHGDRWPRQ